LAMRPPPEAKPTKLDYLSLGSIQGD